MKHRPKKKPDLDIEDLNFPSYSPSYYICSDVMKQVLDNLYLKIMK